MPILHRRSTGPRQSRWPAVVAALLVLASPLAAAGPAMAHAALVQVTPADGSTTVMAPERVELVFNEAVEAQFAQLAVLGPDAAPVAVGDPVVAGTTVSVELGDVLPAGEYAVTYRVVSVDGHPVTGEVRFRHAPEPSATPEASGAAVPVPDAPVGAPGVGEQPEAPPSGRDTASDSGVLPAALTAAVVTVGVVAAALWLRRARRVGPGSGTEDERRGASAGRGSGRQSG